MSVFPFQRITGTACKLHTFLQIYYTPSLLFLSRNNACRQPLCPVPVSLKKYFSFLKIPLAFSLRLGYNTSRTFLSSSMAEHSAVNRRVVGSSPTWGAKGKRPPSAVFFLSLYVGSDLQPEGNSRRLLTGAEPSAAGGRSSEAQHGQNKEKTAQRAVIDYVLPPFRVVGSSPTWGAKRKRPPSAVFFLSLYVGSDLQPEGNTRRLSQTLRARLKFKFHLLFSREQV